MMQINKKIETRHGSGAVEGSPKWVTEGTTVRHGRCEVTGLASTGRYKVTDQEDLKAGLGSTQQIGYGMLLPEWCSTTWIWSTNVSVLARNGYV